MVFCSFTDVRVCSVWLRVLFTSSSSLVKALLLCSSCAFTFESSSGMKDKQESMELFYRGVKIQRTKMNLDATASAHTTIFQAFPAVSHFYRSKSDVPVHTCFNSNYRETIAEESGTGLLCSKAQIEPDHRPRGLLAQSVACITLRDNTQDQLKPYLI